MRLSLIVAMSRNRVIGRDGQLPWHLPADLQRFKHLTMGHHLIMGRVTFESIGRALPGRTSIVVSRTRDLEHHASIKTARSLADALALADEDDEPFVIGGGQLFQEALPRADRIYVTRVHADLTGDVWFPEIDLASWRRIERTEYAADENNRYPCSFLVYDRN